MARRTFAYAAIAVLAVLGPVSAQSQQQRNVTTQNQQRPAQDQRGTETQPLAVKIIPTAEPASQAKRDQEDRAGKANADWWAKAFGIGAILIGIVQAVIFGLQLCVFGLQAKRLKETVKKMDDTAIIQLRAYLSGRARAIEGFRAGGKPAITVYLENCGQTPAFKVAHYGTLMIQPYPLEGDFDLLPPRDEPLSSTSVTAKSDDLRVVIPWDKELNPAEVAAVKQENATMRLYVVGVLVYDDVFKKRRYEKFCAACTPSSLKQIGASGNGDVSVEYMQYHNEANWDGPSVQRSEPHSSPFLRWLR